MYKVGVIGDYDSICAFSALGLDISPCETQKDAETALKTMAQNDYGVIYITEPYFEKLADGLSAYKDAITPAVIPIPSVKGAEGTGRNRMKKYVEQAVGSDIIYND